MKRYTDKKNVHEWDANFAQSWKKGFTYGEERVSIHKSIKQLICSPLNMDIKSRV